MKDRDTSSLIQVSSLFVIVALFIWDNRNLKENEFIIFWIFMCAILLIFIIYSISFYSSIKVKQININTTEIKKLRDQIYFRKSLEEINYRLGKSYGKKWVLNPNQTIIVVIIVLVILYILWKSGYFG